MECGVKKTTVSQWKKDSTKTEQVHAISSADTIKKLGNSNVSTLGMYL